MKKSEFLKAIRSAVRSYREGLPTLLESQHTVDTLYEGAEGIARQHDIFVGDKDRAENPVVRTIVHMEGQRNMHGDDALLYALTQIEEAWEYYLEHAGRFMR